jgi:hypothetical protein
MPYRTLPVTLTVDHGEKVMSMPPPAALVTPAGYGSGDPLLVSMRQGSAPRAFVTRGRTAVGEPTTVDRADEYG